ncbi:MAG: hypothetical protein Q8O67_30910 [Deltaproteobacteria bacterium]|nr:hypothetical protein [Deltaproteobacteria bacterium]
MRIVVVVVVVVALFAGCDPPASSEGEGEGEGEGPAVDFGFVSLVDEPLLNFTLGSAVFRRGLPRAFECTQTDIAGCVVLECGSEPLAFEPVSAGAIDVVGALAPVTLSFVDGAYTDFTNGRLFANGEVLVATAAGDEVPAFSLEVQGPEALTILDPPWPAQQEVLPVTRADGLHIEWGVLEGPSAGDVVVTLNTLDQSTAVSCTFAADPNGDGTGAVDIPPDVLLALPGGDAFIDIDQRATAIARVGTWEVALQASTHALISFRDLAIATVLLD